MEIVITKNARGSAIKYIPKDVLLHPNLNSASIRLYSTLLMYGEGEMTRYLISDCNMNSIEIREAKKELERFGFIYETPDTIYLGNRKQKAREICSQPTQDR